MHHVRNTSSKSPKIAGKARIKCQSPFLGGWRTSRIVRLEWSMSVLCQPSLEIFEIVDHRHRLKPSTMSGKQKAARHATVPAGDVTQEQQEWCFKQGPMRFTWKTADYLQETSPLIPTVHCRDRTRATIPTRHFLANRDRIWWVSETRHAH